MVPTLASPFLLVENATTSLSLPHIFTLMLNNIQWLSEAMLRHFCARSSCCVCSPLGSGQICVSVTIF